MTNPTFKKGDRVRAISNNYGVTNKTNEWEGIVDDVYGKHFTATSCHLKDDTDFDFQFSNLHHSDFELIKPKNKQRIDNLEKQFEKFGDLEAHLLRIPQLEKEIKELREIVSKSQQEVKNDLKFNVGDKVKIIDSKNGNKGDYGIVTGTEGYHTISPKTGIKIFCQYTIEVTTGSNKGKNFVANNENIELALSKNDERTAIIEEAKAFIEETMNFTGRITGRKGYKYTATNNTSSDAYFSIDTEKRKVTVVLKEQMNEIEKAIGVAKCAPGDVFNEHIGKAIALGRALGIDVSKFEQVVQPDEIVPGMIVCGSAYKGFYSVDRIFTLTEENEKCGYLYKEATQYGSMSSNDWILKRQIGGIVNDTNAEY